tara:strand:+ start:76 stop:228 length:153 start_codon:yes stop_codon:yes gene_type:complete
MNMNYSKQTYATVIQQYEWRVESLLSKIDELNARLEISDAEFDKIRKEIF